MEKHYRNIKNEMAYFNKVVKNMDLDDIEKEKKHANNNVHSLSKKSFNPEKVRGLLV